MTRTAKAILAPTVLIAAALFGLTGCHKMMGEAYDGRVTHHGRYAGIGLFEPGKMWAKLQGEESKDPAAAKPGDDETIIVVIDSDTGEVRECGNYSGRCISMNPWTKAVAPQQHSPVAVDAHAAELANDGVGEQASNEMDTSRPTKVAPDKSH